MYGCHGEVTQRQRGGIGGIGGPRWCGQAESHLHHLLNLCLTGSSPSGHGFLDLIGGVLNDRTFVAVSQSEDQATGLTNAHGRAHIGLKEDLLDGDGLGVELPEKVLEISVQPRQTTRKGLVGRGS